MILEMTRPIGYFEIGDRVLVDVRLDEMWTFRREDMQIDGVIVHSEPSRHPTKEGKTVTVRFDTGRELQFWSGYLTYDLL